MLWETDIVDNGNSFKENQQVRGNIPHKLQNTTEGYFWSEFRISCIDIWQQINAAVGGLKRLRYIHNAVDSHKSPNYPSILYYVF